MPKAACGCVWFVVRQSAARLDTVSPQVSSDEPLAGPDEAGLREWLLRLLAECGLQPEHDWIDVRALRYALKPVRFTYTVTIKHDSARAPLAYVLRQATGRVRTDENIVWVLSDAQMSLLLAETRNSSNAGETK